jgi:hypothetical protein
MRHLIHDQDGKYPALSDTVPADSGITVVRSGVQVPRMNAIMERWVRTCRRELLDRALSGICCTRSASSRSSTTSTGRIKASTTPTPRTPARTDHQPGPAHPATRPPPRPSRQPTSRIRTCRMTSTDVILGKYSVVSSVTQVVPAAATPSSRGSGPARRPPSREEGHCSVRSYLESRRTVKMFTLGRGPCRLGRLTEVDSRFESPDWA